MQHVGASAAATTRTWVAGPLLRQRAELLLAGTPQQDHDEGACTVQGPVLRSIQRYGRLGRRSGNVPEESLESRDKIKEAKYIYLSIDEAGTHVACAAFGALACLLSPWVLQQPGMHTNSMCACLSIRLPRKVRRPRMLSSDRSTCLAHSMHATMALYHHASTPPTRCLQLIPQGREYPHGLQTSVSLRTCCARQVVGAYDEAGEMLLGACFLPPISVLANNDVLVSRPE